MVDARFSLSGGVPAPGGPTIAPPQLSSKLCYTKSGESTMVSLYNDPFKVAETTESIALARGILPCG
ncbi:MULTISPECIES: hypothetical protein [unclassified Rhizobium]|uniref:hypothetical protein n=1 Tax=unclassified Rhizobium TaxID=2613769 RepID=UPI001A97F338|nr:MULTISPECIES: hypothetical protein [unclassified Rhizobium]MBX5164537.1 hypothetical protein [Rhizobium sp. NZLR4b]MBX5190853.1 hypothetical protein [Rhizobium sp. NZLR3b]MBX5204468.1 hypothetical protein [Rhizobium sp. NZLR1]QSZ24688.1 hypothetical protein J3O30_30535 [Rhizobium sp. NZLR1]